MSQSERQQMPEPDDRAPEIPADASDPMLYCARQPILDREQRVFGYELLFRDGPENRFPGVNPDWASTVNIEQGTAAFGLDALVGRHLAFVNLSHGALLAGYHQMLPRDRVVLELLEDIPADEHTLQACRRMRADGYRIALDDYTGEANRQDFLVYADFVKADLHHWNRALDPETVQSLRARGIRMLAEKVETRAQAEQALAAGYDLLQGFHFCEPEMVAIRDLPPSKLSVLRFMAEVGSDEISLERLEAVFRADLGLTLRLLRHLNSAAFGLRHEVKSIRHALALLGERPLRRWATMLAMMTLCDDRPHELLVTALSRGRFAERIATPSGLPEHENELFLAGMLTLVDSMVGRPAEEILAGLAINDTVRNAVLRRASPLGPVLDLVTAYQRGDWSLVQSTREHIHVESTALDEAYADSIRWAEEVSR